MKEKGFSIIELLLVVLIIAVLIAIVIVSMSYARERARMGNNINYEGQIYRIIGNTCVGVWDFEEGSGSSARDTCFGNTAELAGEVAWVAGVNNGTALEFSGNGGYVRIPQRDALNNLDKFTISMWVHPKNMQGTKVVASKFDPGSWSWRLIMLDGGALRFSFTTNGGFSSLGHISTTGVALTENRWNHIVVAVDASAGIVDMVIDTERVPTEAMNTPLTAIHVNQADVFIGAAIDEEGGINQSNFFIGYIDNFRFYASKLEVLAILDLYYGEFQRYSLVEMPQ